MWIDHINATNVTMHSHGRKVLRYIPELTFGINHFNVVNFYKAFTYILCDIQARTHTGDKPFSQRISCIVCVILIFLNGVSIVFNSIYVCVCLSIKLN